MFTPRIAVLVLLLAVLTGCGVHVEIAPPLLPTPTPRPYPDIDYSLGGVWRLVATPQMAILAPDQADAEIFMQPQRDLYVIQGRQIWLAAEYRVSWFAAPQSSVQIRFTAYTRPNEQAVWTAYDSVEHNVITQTAPHTASDTLGLMIYLEDLPTAQIRTEITLVSYLASGATLNRSALNDFQVYYLADSGDIATDTDLLLPPWGELSTDQLLWDWRNWQGGVCPLYEQLNSIALAAICTAQESGDFDAIRRLLEEVTPNTAASIQANLLAQQGLLATRSGDFEAAIRYFGEAVTGFVAQGNALQTAAALHNWMTAFYSIQHYDEAYQALLWLQELRGQAYDELGEKLTQANLGQVWGEDWRIEEAYTYFAERESPLASILQRWLNEEE